MLVPLATVALAAGFTPAALCPKRLPIVAMRDFFRQATTVYRRESRPVAKRPADEREPFGFPLICPYARDPAIPAGLGARRLSMLNA